MAIVCYPNLIEPISIGDNNASKDKNKEITENDATISSDNKSNEIEMISNTNENESSQSSTKTISSSNFYTNTKSSITTKLSNENKVEFESADEADCEDSNDAFQKADKINDLKGKCFEKL